MTSNDSYYRNENNEDTSRIFPRTNLSAGPLHLRNESQPRIEEIAEVLSRNSYLLYVDQSLIGYESHFSEQTQTALEMQKPANDDRRRRKRGKSFTCVAFSRSDDSIDEFIMFDKDKEKIYHSRDVLALGRTDFQRRSVPRANIEVLIPTAAPIPITSKKDGGEHHLGNNLGFDAPEEEIVFAVDSMVDGGSESFSESDIATKPKGWEIKVDEKYLYLRKGDWELEFNVQMRIDETYLDKNDDDDDDCEFHLEMSSAHDMVYLHRIMTNIGLNVFFDVSRSQYKTNRKRSKPVKTLYWSLGGKMRKMKLRHSLLRHLKGNEFNGLEWNPVDEVASPPAENNSGDSSFNTLFQTGCILDDHFCFDVFTDERLKKLAYEKLVSCCEDCHGHGSNRKRVPKHIMKQKKGVSLKQ